MLLHRNYLKMVKYHAYAKINLGLGILGKRTDGYHEIFTLMVPVSIADRLSVKIGNSGLRICCPDLPDVDEKDNLAYKAAASVFQKRPNIPGLVISIDKNIPANKGLGGGSSDAAAVLLALKEMQIDEKGLSQDFLMQKAAGIGSDVSFFMGVNAKPPLWQAALCTGRGEEVRPVPKTLYWVVMVYPHVKVSTGRAYSQWDAFHPSVPGLDEAVFSGVQSKIDPRIDNVLDAFLSKDPEKLGRFLFNDFEKPVYSFYPELFMIKEKLLSSGAFGAMLTGSGSALYGVCASHEHACRVKHRFLKTKGELPISGVDIAVTGVTER